MRTPRLLVLDAGGELAAQVTRATTGMRPRPNVASCLGFEEMEQVTGEEGPVDVLIAGPVVATESGFQRLRELRVRAPETRLILAFDRWRSTSLRDTVRTGALDALRLPVTDRDLLEAIEQALAVGPAEMPRRTDGAAKAEGRGTVIAVVSATGGCGKTFFATNLAYHLQARPDKEACLIDLDLQFGELATALRVRPHHTIHDLLLADSEGDDLGRRLEDHLERHESGIRLLSAPEEPAQADAIDAVDVARVIEAARSRFDYVIVDTPGALGEEVVAAIEQADLIFALATLDLPSIRNLGVMLTTLKKLKVPTEKVQLLLNKVEPDVGIDATRVEEYFPQGFAMVIPYGREVNRSLNMGQPVLAYAPRGEVSKSLAAGLARLVAFETPEADDHIEPKKRWRHPRAGRKSA